MKDEGSKGGGGWELLEYNEVGMLVLSSCCVDCVNFTDVVIAVHQIADGLLCISGNFPQIIRVRLQR